MAKRGTSRGYSWKGTRGDDEFKVTLNSDKPWKLDGGGGNDYLTGGGEARMLQEMDNMNPLQKQVRRGFGGSSKPSDIANQEFVAANL